MSNTKGKKIFFILYVILACADFLYSIFNLIRHFFYTEFSLSMLFSSLGMRILYLLPLIALIILSKTVSEIEDSQKIMKIKKYVIIYLFACLIFGAVNYLIKVPFFISCLFYTNSWLFYLIYIIAYNQLYLIYSLVLDICFFVISILFIKKLGKKKRFLRRIYGRNGKNFHWLQAGNCKHHHSFNSDCTEYNYCTRHARQYVRSFWRTGNGSCVCGSYPYCIQSFPGPDYSSCNSTFHCWYCKM